MKNNTKETKTKKNKAAAEHNLPHVGVKWTKKRLGWTLFACVCAAVLGVFGFLLYQQYKQPIANALNLPEKQVTPQFKNYVNDYYGFKFRYPGFWFPVIGSYQDGDYYFASEPINFITELEAGQALVEVKTFVNWKNLSFADWLSDQQMHYLPRGTIQLKSQDNIAGVQAVRYTVTLNQPVNGTNFWEVAAISKNDNIKYLFILETDTQKTNQDFSADFQSILNSLEFYQGFGAN